MAGSAVVPAKKWLGIWHRFQDLAEFRIREGNLIAGERMWEIMKPPDVSTSLIIRSAKRPEYFAECRINPGTGVLTSRWGTGPVLRFQLCNEPFSGAGTQAAHSRIEDAVNAILDQLEWSDDMDQPTRGVN